MIGQEAVLVAVGFFLIGQEAAELVVGVDNDDDVQIAVVVVIFAVAVVVGDVVGVVVVVVDMRVYVARIVVDVGKIDVELV